MDKSKALIVKSWEQYEGGVHGGLSFQDNLSNVNKYIFSCLLKKEDFVLACHKNVKGYGHDYLIKRCLEIINKLDDNYKIAEDITEKDIRHIACEYTKTKILEEQEIKGGLK